MSLPSNVSYMLPSLPPPSRAGWTLATDRAALLVHDMQRYFCAPYDPAADPLRGIIANIAHLLSAARGAGMPIFYTAQKGAQLRADRGLQADLWGAGMRAEPGHEEILPSLAPQQGDHLLVKHRYSAFQRSNLAPLMRARGRDQLLIVGVYAHIGCLCTAAEAFQHDIQPFAVTDAQADFDRAQHDMAMAWVAATCGVVLDSAAALRAIGGQADAA